MAIETIDWLHGGHYTKAGQEKSVITVSADCKPNQKNVLFLEVEIKFSSLSFSKNSRDQFQFACIIRGQKIFYDALHKDELAITLSNSYPVFPGILINFFFLFFC